MTSRERVMLALNHKEADRMPIDFGGTQCSGISGIAYNNVQKYLGIDDEIILYDIYMQIVEPQRKMLDRFHGDVVQLHRLAPDFGIRIDKWKKGELTDGTKCKVPLKYNPASDEKGNRYITDESGKQIAKMPKGGLYFDVIDHPLQKVEEAGEIGGLMVFPVISDEECQWLKKQVKILRESSDRAILGTFGASIYEAGQKDFGYLEYYMNIGAEPELIHHYNTLRLEAYLKSLKKYLEAVGKDIDIIYFVDDLGSQKNAQISPDMYREMIMPYHKAMFDYVHKNYPELKIFFHSCGAILKLIPGLIEAGIDILNPVQLTAADMDAVELKSRFGDKLTFWGGGCNVATTGTDGSVEDVCREVRELTDIFKPGGGYVFNQIHNIQANVPTENIIAIYDTAFANSAY